jgi:hypothetical protein
MLKYFISILLLAATVNASAQDVEEEEERPAIVDSAHQLRLGFDISRILFNQLQKDKEERISYELELDFYWRKDLYIVAEGGWGNASLNYPDLAYKSNNIFFRAGINKSLLPRLKQDDWDMGFIGLRYGVGLINRSNANYTITDSTWGVIAGTVPGTGLTAHWIELTGGVRVEIAKHLFLGWNMRGKFLVNAKQFKELPPYNIAGYGKGEKNTVFDFNVFLSYAIRWDRKHIPKPKE